MLQTQVYSQLLRESGLDRADALALFQAACGRGRAWLIAHDQDPVSTPDQEAFEALANRRRQGEPVAYILGQREFFSRDFRVTPAVLIPRPETELLVELALARATQAAQVLDMGCGSGCIPVTLKLERPDLQVTALDISADALEVARGNAKVLGAQISFLQSNWFAALQDESFDVIVSNPPYIEKGDLHLQQGDLRFEPRSALTDEQDGLAHLRRIIAGSKRHLQKEGWLLLEHGWDQGAAVRHLLIEAGFVQVQTWQDLAGLDRVSGGNFLPL